MLNNKAKALIDELRTYGAFGHAADVRFLDRTAILIVERYLREAAGMRETMPAGVSSDEWSDQDEERRLQLLMGGGN